MTRAPEDLQDFEDLALSLYLGPHIAGRRVLWVGRPRGGVVRKLEAVVARLSVLDASAGSRPRRSRGGAPTNGGEEPLRLPDGSFDVAIVDDLRQLGARPRERLAAILRSVPGGSVVVGTRPRDDAAFAAVDAELRTVLPEVQWFGQGPLGGFAIGRLDEAPASSVVVDGSLQDPDAVPSRLVAVSGALAAALDPYLLVTCPAGAAPDARADSDGRVEALERMLAERNRDLAALEAEVARSEDAAGKVQRVEKELVEARRTLERLASAAPTRVEADLEALEAKLREAGHRALELETEVERRGLLVRDLMEAPPGRRQGGALADEATRRAVRAEAEKAAARFENDELRARLLEADPARLRALENVEAELRGVARGLEARLAELEELHATTEAQLALARADLEEARGRERALEARLAESREELELELVRARMAGSLEEKARDQRGDLEERLAELVLSEKKLSERVGSLSGQLMAARELQQRAESELRALRRVPDPSPSRAGEVRSPADTVELRRQRGEIEGLRARMRDREAALADLRARAELAEEVPSPTTAGPEVQGLVHELERRALERNELVAAVAARDGLVTRLQIELAELERRGESSDDRRDDLTLENERLREAVLDASEAMDALEASRARAGDLEAQLMAARAVGVEIDVLSARLERAEHEKREALDALSETRRILASADLSGGTRAPGASGITAVDVESPEGGSGEGWGRRGEPSVPPVGGVGGDAEMLMRSLTAQLDAKNDRLRALERLLAERGGDATGSPDAQRLLELEERVARLGSELGHEKAAREAAERALREAAARLDAPDRADALQKELEVQREKLDVMRGRAETFERDVDSLRSVCAQTRHGLEALLGTATASGNPQMAERLGALLSVLARF